MEANLKNKKAKNKKTTHKKLATEKKNSYFLIVALS